MAYSSNTDDLKSYKGKDGVVQRWIKEIDIVRQSKQQSSFENVGERIIRKFRNQSDLDTIGTSRWSPNLMFNYLWSNIQVLEPALYSRMPKPVVERSFKDKDPIGLFASEVLERATYFNMRSQEDEINYVMSLVVQDRLLVGRGVAKVQFKTEWDKATDENGEVILDDKGEPVQIPRRGTQRVELVHYNWLDYLESIARTQQEIRWRAFSFYKTKDELISLFGEEVACKISLDVGPEQRKRSGQDEDQFLKQAQIWCIEDRASNKVFWIAPGYLEAPLFEEDDPYKLVGFWTAPFPLLATTTSTTTYPVADYVIYAGMADEYNAVALRLKNIVNCIRLVGAVAASFSKDIKNITRLSDGSVWPMENWGGFVEKGGFKGLLDWAPFDQCVAALGPLIEYQQFLKTQLDEITSMPDIARGSSDPNDPVYTQQQKSHWTVIKLIRKQQDVQRFCREWVSKMAQMLVEPGFFDDETIWEMAGVGQMTPEKQGLFTPAMELLRNDRLRTFRIAIETDSTIAIDEEQAMSRWSQFLQTMQGVVANAEQLTQMAPGLIEPVLEASLAAVRTLRTGRSVEGAFERAMDEWAEAKREAKEAPPEPPPPDPAMIRAQTEQMKLQQDAQIEFEKLGLEKVNQQFEQWIKTQALELDNKKIESDFAIKAEANKIDAGKIFSTQQLDQMYADIEAFRVNLENRVQEFKAELERERIEFEKQSKALEIKEKLMEEARLERQERLQTERTILEHSVALKQAEIDARGREIEFKQNAEPKESMTTPPFQPIVNVHLKGGKKVFRKISDTEYETEEVDE
jgi:hypothetical protein